MARLLSVRRLAGPILGGMLMLVSVVPASAQGSPPANAQSAQQACQPYIAQFCPGVQPGGGRLIRCLDQHYGQLPQPCQAGLDRARPLLPLMEACAADIEQYCPQAVEQGGQAVRNCMMQNRARLSPHCRSTAMQMRGQLQ